MTKALQELVSRRFEAMKCLCQMAESEQKLAESWLNDKTSVDKYYAWAQQKRLLLHAFSDWQRITDALMKAVEADLRYFQSHGVPPASS